MVHIKKEDESQIGPSKVVQEPERDIIGSCLSRKTENLLFIYQFWKLDHKMNQEISSQFNMTNEEKNSRLLVWYPALEAG